MLYDPKWEKTKTKAAPFSLSSLIAWLEQKPADETYCYEDTGGCLLHKYFTPCGFTNVLVGGMSLVHGSQWQHYKRISAAMQDIPLEHPRTFGAALERARAAVR